MTEEEKRKLALQIMQQEQARLRSHTQVFQEQNNQRLDASLARSAERKKAYAALEQQGHTWQEFSDAYTTAYD